jgi:hypothetical protein
MAPNRSGLYPSLCQKPGPGCRARVYLHSPILSNVIRPVWPSSALVRDAQHESWDGHASRVVPSLGFFGWHSASDWDLKSSGRLLCPSMQGRGSEVANEKLPDVPFEKRGCCGAGPNLCSMAVLGSVVPPCFGARRRGRSWPVCPYCDDPNCN